MYPERRAPRSYAPVERAERLVAVTRAVFVLVTLLAVADDPDISLRGARQAFPIAAIYSLVSFVVLWLVWRGALQTPRGRLITHVMDVVACSMFMFVMQVGASPFFNLFAFPLFCATIRFGRRGIAGTGLALLAIYVAAATLNGVPASDPSFFMIRITYLTIATLVLVATKEYQVRMQEDLSRLANWARTAPEERDSVIRASLISAGDLLRCGRVLMVWEEGDEPAVNVALLADGECSLSTEDPEWTAVDESIGEATFFSRDIRTKPTIVTGESGRAEAGESPLVPEFSERYGIRSVLSAVIDGQTVRGRIFFLDAKEITQDDATLAEIVAGMAASRLDWSSVMERIRATAIIDERIRLARDLHDGLLQSLAAVAIQLESVRQMAGADPTAERERIRAIQQIVIDGQADLRSFITRLRPNPVGHRVAPLHVRLQGLAARFRENWGLDVSLHLDPPHLDLGAASAAEVFSLVNEGLSNAAKHARAERLVARITVGPDSVEIVIEDDGVGFPFHGVWDLPSLDRAARGPVTLRERVASNGGTLVLHSSDHGSRVEISIPV